MRPQPPAVACNAARPQRDHSIHHVPIPIVTEPLYPTVFELFGLNTC